MATLPRTKDRGDQRKNPTGCVFEHRPTAGDASSAAQSRALRRIGQEATATTGSLDAGHHLGAARLKRSFSLCSALLSPPRGIRFSYDRRMVPSSFESFSQNGEDVVLWRAFHHICNGRYIEVGANHPENDSVTMAFYRRGWSGITIEPDPVFAQLQREERPRDLIVEAAITVKDHDTMTFHVVDGTGLSTLDADLAGSHAEAGYETHDIVVTTRTMNSILDEAGWHGSDIHFMSVDTEGSERDVLESIDFGIWRPWVLVVEATAPNSTESTRMLWEDLVLGAGYHFCLFDGLSCFYVAGEHAASLSRALSYPSCILDNYTTREYRELTERSRKLAERVQSIPDLVEQVTRWRGHALNRWANAVARETELEMVRAELSEMNSTIAEMNAAIHLERIERNLQIDDLHAQVDEMQESTSWRITRPLRFLSRMVTRTGLGR